MKEYELRLEEIYKDGLIAESDNRFNDARQLFEIAANSGHPFALIKLGDLYKESGKSKESTECYQKAFSIDQKNSLLLSELNKRNLINKENQEFEEKIVLKGNIEEDSKIKDNRQHKLNNNAIPSGNVMQYSSNTLPPKNVASIDVKLINNVMKLIEDLNLKNVTKNIDTMTKILKYFLILNIITLTLIFISFLILLSN